ncbi:MAG: bifunctional hydroxymethylpyrimidine kinase/phosphomethylpyrimidine kinase [Pseudomonadota bacterium]
MTPIALTIAGSDSGGGAGVQADLKAFSALGVYGASVITAITAQNTKAVTAVEGVSLPVVAAQIEAVLSDLSVSAIKIGMLATPQIIDIVADGLANFHGPIVLDPVMVAKSGDALLQDDAVSALVERLLPMAEVLTPNLPEAARLLNEAASTEASVEQGQKLLSMGPKSILLKGGHGVADVCTDLFLRPDSDPIALSSPRIETRNTHGTGCTFSSAITANLAKGQPLEAAVRDAHAWLAKAIAAADTLSIGSGHGPVHHFHEIWR